MIAYATFKQCYKAVLIYPRKLKESVNVSKGDIRVRRLAFILGEDLEQADKIFLDELLLEFS